MVDLDGSTIRACRDVFCGLLSDHVGGDWRATRGPDIEMNVGELVAHVALTGIWYSVDLSARGPDLRAVKPVIETDVGNRELVETASAMLDMLATIVDAAPGDARGYHPSGQADRSGFAAMACDEMLVHGHDIASALGTDFAPPDELAESVLGRLFPWVASAGPAGQAWQRLLWANGRIALDGNDRLERWRWHCAPLAEWNGEQPR